MLMQKPAFPDSKINQAQNSKGNNLKRRILRAPHFSFHAWSARSPYTRNSSFHRAGSRTGNVDRCEETRILGEVDTRESA